MFALPANAAFSAFQTVLMSKMPGGYFAYALFYFSVLASEATHCLFVNHMAFLPLRNQQKENSPVFPGEVEIFRVHMLL